MKKLKKLSAFLFLFTVLGMVSCETEPVDSELVGNNPENPDNPNNPGPSTGDYWPLAVNNQWVFNLDGQLQEPIDISGTVVVEGNTYYTINYNFTEAGTGGLTGTTYTGLRKDGGNYLMRVSVDMPDENGFTINVTPFEYILFKDNLEAGGTWSQTVTQVTTMESEDFPMPIPPTELTLDFDGTILEKDVTATVNGVTYDDVIKVKVIQTATLDENPGVSIVIESIIWYAKGVGPIRSEGTVNGETTVQELDSYQLN